MRSDFNKVVTERPRAGGGKPKGLKREQARLWPDLPVKESMIRPYVRSFCEKSFTDLLGPIYGYLHSKVGQPWDDVWSEICTNLRITSVSQGHIRDHLDGMVTRNIILIDGEPHESDGKPIYDRYSRPTYWVHPVNGLLMERKPQRPHSYAGPYGKPRYKQVKVDDLHRYVRINGNWFLVTLKPIPIAPFDTYGFQPFDVVLKDGAQSGTYGTSRKEWGADVYAVAKKSLGKREIKRLKLNDPS